MYQIKLVRIFVVYREASQQKYTYFCTHFLGAIRIIKSLTPFFFSSTQLSMFIKNSRIKEQLNIRK